RGQHRRRGGTAAAEVHEAELPSPLGRQRHELIGGAVVGRTLPAAGELLPAGGGGGAGREERGAGRGGLGLGPGGGRLGRPGGGDGGKQCNERERDRAQTTRHTTSPPT